MTSRFDGIQWLSLPQGSNSYSSVWAQALSNLLTQAADTARVLNSMTLHLPGNSEEHALPNSEALSENN